MTFESTAVPRSRVRRGGRAEALLVLFGCSGPAVPAGVESAPDSRPAERQGSAPQRDSSREGSSSHAGAETFGSSGSESPASADGATPLAGSDALAGAARVDAGPEPASALGSTDAGVPDAGERDAGEPCPEAGRIEYRLDADAAWPAQARERIVAAMDEALFYYNCHADLGHQLTVSYDPAVPTAEANVDGRIRFGSSPGYMVVATAMHEVAHTLGRAITPGPSCWSTGAGSGRRWWR